MFYVSIRVVLCSVFSLTVLFCSVYYILQIKYVQIYNLPLTCSQKLDKLTNNVSNVKNLIGKENEGISFKKHANHNAFCDSDFTGDQSTGKSTTGYIIYYGEGPISWSSKKQEIVSLSSSEAEYVAAADCTKELLYVKSVIEDLIGESISIELNVDNQSAIKMIKTVQ